MGNNITYLFGAGASAGSDPKDPIVPLVKDFPDKINEFRTWVGKIRLNSIEELDDVRDKLIDDITSVHRGCKKHASIDTFARELSHKEKNEELVILKSVLDAFLIYYQFKEFRLDKRYDAFIAGILTRAINDELFFPGNIKILSWNYDIQFELTSRNYIERIGTEALTRYKLQMIPHQSNYQIVPDWFSYVKLNGSSGAEIIDDKYQRRWQEYITFIDSPCDEGFLSQLLRSYKERKEESKISALTFAWEHSPMAMHSLESAKAIAEITNTLVVIGYSFPSFNRSVDKALLRAMKSLREIIIQVPNDFITEAELKVNDILSSIGRDFDTDVLPKVKVTPYPGVSEFFIPSTFFHDAVLEIIPEKSINNRNRKEPHSSLFRSICMSGWRGKFYQKE